MLKLTPRQQAFLDKLFELYRELKKPAHYSTVADALGVNKFSAYDMLKVLEEKEMVASTYVLNDEQNGPGRSQVLFYPTHKAAQFLTELKDEMRYSSDWQNTKENILHQLEESCHNNSVEAIREALSKLPDVKTPLNYCAGMISVLVLNLERMRDQNLRPALEAITTKGRVGLAALAGLSLASALATDPDDASLTEKWLANTKRFQTQLGELSEESVTKLSAFLSDAMNVLRRPSAS
jgi:hypothetical protein